MNSLQLPSVQPTTVVYEDDDLLILNKPAGVVVNRAQTVATATVQDWIDKHSASAAQPFLQNFPQDWESQIPSTFTPEYGSPQEIFVARTGIAHRLDKDTSGIFVCTKHPGALLSLLEQFRERTVEKRYLCLTHGKFALPTGEIRVPIGRRSGDRKLFGVVADGCPALTTYAVDTFFPSFNEDKLTALIAATNPPQTQQPKKHPKKQRFTMYQGFSLVSCWPKTGRTHQIRVHMAHLQHPLVGDGKYVGKKRARVDELWCARQFLHAAEITLTHPRSKERVTFTAPLPADLSFALEFMNKLA